jgi:hypothetical protein
MVHWGSCFVTMLKKGLVDLPDCLRSLSTLASGRDQVRHETFPSADLGRLSGRTTLHTRSLRTMIAE